jgi:hypothetical protein
MAKSVTAGDMRTRITVNLVTPGVDADGFPSETLTNPFGGQVRCKWVNAHGSDVLENNRLELGQIATITMRYTSLITPKCIVWHENETGTVANPKANAWDVISVNDPEDRHRFIEVTLRRKVVA